MWSMIVAALKIVALFLTEKMERDREIKERKRESRKDLAAAIKTRDPSEITKAFDRVKR